MPYDVKQTKTYQHPAAEVIKSATAVISKLGGKPSKKSNPDQGWLDVNFNKKIKNEYMNNRCQLEVRVTPQSVEQCVVAAEAYPVDPVGGKLMFGVQGKPARQVIEAFFAELEAEIGA